MSLTIGRNDICLCGSEKKFKKCCMNNPDFKIETYAKELEQRHKLASSSFSLKDLKTGTGIALKSNSQVSVHYTGWLYDPNAKDKKGTSFDSSLSRNEAFEFVLGKGMVIEGWDLGLLGMKKGGKRLLHIPPEMAYGSQKNGQIPPNSTLIFEVELLEFNQK